MPLYIPEPLKSVPLAPWFLPDREDTFFAHAGRSVFFKEQVHRVDVSAAQAIVLQNNFISLPEEAVQYIKEYADLGERYGISVVIFSLSDFNDELSFDPRVRVLRLSTYGSTLRPQDIVMPTFTEDIGTNNVMLRPKTAIPIISFCGQAGYATVRQWIKYILKNSLFDIRSIANPLTRARKIGVYWRRAAIRACRNSTLVRSNFVIRHSFSGALRTIELDPQQARREFIDNMVNSDFVLAPKGDGNYSNRFLEALSMGRIPVLIDTDVVLPFEDSIEYSKVMVRVPMNRVHETPRYIHAFYDSLGEVAWHERQQLARETYEHYLAPDAFFAQFFARFSGIIESL